MFGFSEKEDDRDTRRPRYNDDNGGERRHNAPIHTEKIVTDRKIFFLDLKENNRGRFIKITEDVRGRRDTIMVPAETIDEFVEALSTIRDVEEEMDE